MTYRLFGEGDTRTRIGSADTEWAVWQSGTDDVLEKDRDGNGLDLGDALELANELNATAASAGNQFEPVTHAVVLHWGYAWTAAADHAHGLDCGVRRCGPCSFNRDFPNRTHRARP
jgi:hypothetical protein